MELLQLKYFCRAAETENFSETAKEYCVPASNISQSIHRLEGELGVILFDRSANKITLNERGREFYTDIKSALQLISDSKSRICNLDAVSGEIRLLIEANRRIVSKAIETFQKKHKDVSFFIDHVAGENINKYDLIITDKVFNNKNMIRKSIVCEDILLAISKNNPLANKKNLQLCDLENERFITMGRKSGIYKFTNEICSTAGFVPNIVIQSDDPFYIRKYVEMGLGVSFFPSVSWHGMFSDDVICRNIVNLKRTTYVYRSAQRYMSKAVEEFLNQLDDK